LEDILIISATNRPGSFSRAVAQSLQQLLLKESVKTHLVSLEDLNDELIIDQIMYDKEGNHPGLKMLQEKHLIPAKNWIWVVPEYNGSIPGILKLWIDICSLYRPQDTFHHKKMALVGVSTGRAGNLRGLDHLTGILHHLNARVMPFALPVSSVHTFMDAKGHFNQDMLEVFSKFLNKFEEYINS